MSTREDLYRALESWDLDLPADLHDRTPLFETGLLDSAGLFHLILWVEERLGRPIDPERFDLSREWASVEDIVRFIETDGIEHARRAHADAPSGRISPAGSGYRVTRYYPGLEADIAELQTGLWSRDLHMNHRYFEWLYRQNPYARGEPEIFVALQGDRVVGMRGFWGSEWETVAGVTPLLVADDLMISRAHRQRGLNGQLMDYACAALRKAGHSLLLSMTASPTNALASLAMGWSSIGALGLTRRQTAGSRAGARLRSALGHSPLLWRFADSPMLHFPSERSPFKNLDDEPSRISEMASLVERLPRDGRVRHVRDRAYFSWRLANPLREYRVLYSGGERLEGYIVLSRHRCDQIASNVVSVADFEAISDEVLVALVREAAERIDCLEFWTIGVRPGVRHALRDMGFKSAGGVPGLRDYPCLLLRQLDGDGRLVMGGRPVADPAAWDLRMLYSMRC